MTLPDAAVGSIVASMIGALVVFLGTVISKEQKTSEFRQIWIDELRKDIAEYVAEVAEMVSLSDIVKHEGEDNKRKFLSENFEIFRKIKTLEHRIVLRLNPIEHSAVVTEVKDYLKNMLAEYAAVSVPQDSERGEHITNKLIELVHEVLRNEWRTVKVGEPVFRWTKRISLFVFFLLFTWGARAAYVYGKANGIFYF
jgi:hypothetical protein